MDKSDEQQNNLTTSNITVSSTILENFLTFLELVPAKRFRKGLRTLFLTYIRSEMSKGFEDYFEEFIIDLKVFFELLDTIEEEYQSD